MRSERFGKLDAKVTGGTDGGGGGSGPVVVLLHGFGAPGTDLVPLGQMLGEAFGQVLDQAREHIGDAAPAAGDPPRFVFFAAPLAQPELMGGRAWWMIDMEALQRAMLGGGRPDFSREKPEGLDDARELLGEAIRALRERLDAAAAPLILGGFSQGAMLSCDFALRSDEPLAGLILFSGSLLCADEWRERMPKRAGLRVFQSHGQSDPILPFGAAERLRDLLREAGLEVSWCAFPGQHAIPPEALSGALELMVTVL
ncbi:alpha/beta hydrolase [Haliangium ochraceum]|uniref:Phospholipase/Carboxylesterase n=1 Tax=Haliangium ochraceum (strain DSM 14365 / JCM 11303 / SMP-2) TaxID=502025 RepID=D0LWK8_HALO1|nr:phospholipase/carboxylesterase [Haliangium ochraceum]ACY17658.1 phospholipase/Carboxylesterase [Haliangium ochraceum DSM 14365]